MREPRAKPELLELIPDDTPERRPERELIAARGATATMIRVNLVHRATMGEKSGEGPSFNGGRLRSALDRALPTQGLSYAGGLRPSNDNERAMTNPRLGHPVKNRNKVPARQWKKWSNHAKKVFNDMYHALRPSMQVLLTHPAALPLPKEHWQTLRWNAAWLAADGVNVEGGAGRAVRIRTSAGRATTEITRVIRKKKRRTLAVIDPKKYHKLKRAISKLKAKRHGR